MLVEPLGHVGGHPSAHTKYLVQTLFNAGIDVHLLTFDGLLGDSMELDGHVKHISFMAEHAALARLVQFLSHLFPWSVVRTQLERLFCTHCTFFKAFRLRQKVKYDVIHILDACTPDYEFPWFAFVVNRCNLVFTLFGSSREVDIQNWQVNLVATLSKCQIMMALQLCSRRLLATRLAIGLREFLYRRGARRNQQAFICYTNSVRYSYSGRPFYRKIVYMFRGVAAPEPGTLTPYEARRRLGLPQDGTIFLNFGINHRDKNFEVIFQAAKDLSEPCNLLFAGRIQSAFQENNPLRLARKYGLYQNVIIVDRYLTDEEVKTYFNAADAAIISHRKDFKGASGVLSAAAQYYLPVIAADTGEIGKAVKGYQLGLTFEAENPHSLRVAILSFLNLSEEQKQEIKMNLSHFARTHSWQQVAQRHIEIYRGLMKSKSRPE